MADEQQLVEYLRKVTTDLQKTRTRLRDVESKHSEPIAIVGMGCRYPGGVRTPEDLWRLVAEGRDEISGFPTDRGWDLAGLYDPDPDAAGKSYTREGGFLTGIERFDADFFGLSPREALSMDPQQRMLLETSWEALERAGIDPATVRGSRTGVFTGVMHHDYGGRFPQAPDGFEGYLVSGSAGSVAAGRVSYLFGLEGPAVTVDTACSSSLVALHLAAQALRNGECDMALAGGVAIMSTPTFFVEYSRQRVLSTDGRCRSFAEDGDGTSWSEGVGVLVVERLSDALRHGHDVLAVIRGSAVNQDGASNGMTAPNGPSQQRVIEAALTHARVAADEVDLIEAHGTGTRLGDPIEAQALIATYGTARQAGRPLYLGSLKSNIGHTQAAAGVAGVIKMVEAMRHGVMPKSLYADRPTTEVDWSAGTVELLADARPWERAGHPRRAAVSSFGMSGTNAHLVLEEYAGEPADEEPVAAPAEGGPVALVVSGKSVAAVRAQAAVLGEFVAARPELALGDVAWSLVASRSVFDHRAVVVGAGRDEVLAGLGEVSGSTAAGAGRVGVLFSGQGAQRVGMGRELADAFPVFAEVLGEVCGHVDPLLGRSLRAVMWEGPAETLERTEFAQPALFAFEVALARLWQSWGVSFATVAGHSVGEIAAAVVAGVLSLEDAAQLAVSRGALMQALPEGGAMLAVGASEEEVVASLNGAADLAVAAVNGPRAVVVSGAEAEVARLEAYWREQERRTIRLRVSHAFHSPLMEPMLVEFRTVLEGLTFHEPTVPVSPSADSRHAFSTSAYWLDHARHAVRFADAVTRMTEADLLVELGPDAALTPVVDDSRPVVAAVRRAHSEPRTVLAALGQAFAHGATVDWRTVLPEGRRVELPTYAFQHQSYWLTAQPAAGAGADAVDHPVLTGAVELPAAGGLLLTGRLSPSTDPWLADHAVYGTVLFPGTGFLELAARAARQAGAGEIADLVLQAPLVLPDTGTDVQVWVAPPGDAAREFVIRARDADGQWQEHAAGTLAVPAATAAVTAAWAAGQWPPAGAVPVPVGGVYEELADRGYAYGPAFRGLRAVWRAGDEVYAEVALPEGHGDARFGIHPALLDAALHTLPLTDGAYREAVRLPFSFARTTVGASGTTELRVRLRVSDEAVRFEAATPAGEPVVATERLVLRATDAGRLRADTAAHLDRLRHEVAWRPFPDAAPAGTVPGTWLVLAAPGADTAWATGLFEDAVTAGLDTAAGRAALAGELAEARGSGAGFAGVLCLAACPEELLLALQALADAGEHARTWCVTRRADEDPDAAAVWGLGRVAALELPDRWGGLIDLPDAADAAGETAGHLAGLLTAATDEDQFRVRPDGVSVRRLVTARPAEEPAPDWTPSGTVLITGGTGSLGGHVARWLAGLGGCSLVLLSRRGPDAPGADELLAELTATGTPTRIIAADVTDRAAMAALVAEAQEAGEPVRAVFHAAGVGAEAPLLETAPADFHAVMAGKTAGARVLDDVLGDTDLDAFVLFSSISGIWGAAGQSGYAAGNAALDALAARRRARGLAGTALAWGPWAGGGMVDPVIEQQLRRRGLTPLPVADGVAALARAVARGTDAVLADVAWPRFLPAFTAARPAPLFTEVAPRERESAAKPAGARPDLAGLPAADRERALLDAVRARIASVLGHTDAAGIDPGRPLREIGFDSLMSVELRNKLSDLAGLRLPATLVFDHPTPAALAAHLADELFTDPAEDDGTAPAPVAPDGDEPIAVVGIGCRYPGGVAGPEDLWRLVAEGRDAIGGFPADRGWDLDGLYDPDPDRTGTAYAREGGFLDDVAGFDAAFFGIPPREALAMDPQQRIMLETAWQAVEHAGIDPQSLGGSRTGVFTGVMYNDYLTRLGGTPDGLEGILGIANSNSVMSGRISYLLGLEGPAVTVDTACSSSLVTLHLACQSLRQGECDLALAGGATVMASPNIFVEFSRQGGLARDGRSKSFSADADGTGWSEGAGVLVVERLSDARRNGHEVLAVIRGSAVNQDGASNGLTAPNGPAQQRVIQAALRRADLRPEQIDAVEAHGTGTRLGDPIEAQALLATYGKDRTAGRPLYLGSLKSNLGHTQAAAGAAGVIKMVQALRHGTLPRTLHAETPSPEVDWSAGTVHLLTEARPWPRGEHPRRAAVSSFGISGTNAHVVLEEGDPVHEPAPAPSPGPVPVPVCARTADALPAQARALHEHLLAHPGLGTADVARTLAATRAAFEHRATVLAGDRDELLAGLAALADPEAVRPASVATGTALRGRTALLFPGPGGQWLGTARALLAGNEVFAASVRACEEALTPWVKWSLTEVLDGTDAVTALPVDIAEPASFAVLVSLAEVWRDWGVPVDGVAGHGHGEIAAACVSGALTLADGARVVAVRSRLLTELSGEGGLLALSLSEDEVRERLGGPLSLAAVDGPRSVVVSGPDAALDELADAARADGVHVRRLDADRAPHSAAVETLRDRLLDALDGIAPRDGAVPLYSTVTGTRLAGHELDAAYWYRNLRETVRLSTAVEALADDGFTFHLPVAPHPATTVGVRRTLEAHGADGVVCDAAPRRDGDATGHLLGVLAEGYVHGLGVDWDRVLPQGRRVPLPGYAFHHERYWLDPVANPVTAPASDVDARFWDAVEREDLEQLTGQLGAVDGLDGVLPALAAWRRESRRRSTLDSWRYRITWRARQAGAGAVPPGRWLVLDPGTPDSGRLRALLADTGLDHTPVTLGAPDTEDRAALAARIAPDGPGAYAGVLSLLGLDERPHPALPGLTTGLALTVTALQALGDLDLDAPVWAVTTGAAGVEDAPARPVQNQLWGLGRVAALEQPRRWGGLADLPADPGADSVATLLDVLARDGDEDQWAVRGTRTWVRRLVRHDRTAPPAGDTWRPAGTVLITGASGSLGPQLARSVAERGATHVALLSRHGAESPGVAELVDELGELGATAHVFACDVRDRDRLAAVLGELADAGHPVTTAVHAAAHLDIAPLETTTLTGFADVMDAKVAGAVHLAELLDRRHLRELVLFSSIAGVWGSGEHGAYAAANAFLDAYAERCRADGLPVTSLAWGLWGEETSGERADHAGLAVRRGLPFMDRATAFAGMYRALGDGEASVTVADVDWAHFAPVFTSIRPGPLLDDLPEAARAAAERRPDATDAGERLRTRLAALTPADRERTVLDLVRSTGATVLGHGTDGGLAPDTEFSHAGFDSMLSVDLRNRLNRATGLDLPPTLLFDHATPRRLAAHLLAALDPRDDTSADALLARLDRIETDIKALPADDTARLRMASRLGALLTAVRGTEADDAYGELETAGSTEELLDLLDSRFGES
ncbi:type I polyketide synthase [Streptomyces sp. NPDC045470]|uniref:type I polyketide synthase n=1 Tax=Streptomyces sp. NPDC045470 TaxID=3155469 RepID=UPI0033D141C6